MIKNILPFGIYSIKRDEYFQRKHWMFKDNNVLDLVTSYKCVVFVYQEIGFRYMFICQSITPQAEDVT